MVSQVRRDFVAWCRSQLGATVLWGQLDCSELVARGIQAVGGKNMSRTHTAQRLHDETPNLKTESDSAMPLEGDLVFYGGDASRVVHVAVWVPSGAISADGATKAITTLTRARAAGAKVREHRMVRFRRDLYCEIHRNTYLDALELVCR